MRDKPATDTFEGEYTNKEPIINGGWDSPAPYKVDRWTKKKIEPITGTGTCIAELQSKINELVDEVNKLKEKASCTVSSSGH